MLWFLLLVWRVYNLKIINLVIKEFFLGKENKSLVYDENFVGELFCLKMESLKFIFKIKMEYWESIIEV